MKDKGNKHLLSMPSLKMHGDIWPVGFRLHRDPDSSTGGGVYFHFSVIFIMTKLENCGPKKRVCNLWLVGLDATPIPKTTM